MKDEIILSQADIAKMDERELRVWRKKIARINQYHASSSFDYRSDPIHNFFVELEKMLTETINEKKLMREFRFLHDCKNPDEAIANLEELKSMDETARQAYIAKIKQLLELPD